MFDFCLLLLSFYAYEIDKCKEKCKKYDKMFVRFKITPYFCSVNPTKQHKIKTIAMERGIFDFDYMQQWAQRSVLRQANLSAGRRQRRNGRPIDL